MAFAHPLSALIASPPSSVEQPFLNWNSIIVTSQPIRVVVSKKTNGNKTQRRFPGWVDPIEPKSQRADEVIGENVD